MAESDLRHAVLGALRLIVVRMKHSRQTRPRSSLRAWQADEVNKTTDANS
jgi:hypothetical protein